MTPRAEELPKWTWASQQTLEIDTLYVSTCQETGQTPAPSWQTFLQRPSDSETVIPYLPLRAVSTRWDRLTDISVSATTYLLAGLLATRCT